uniref:Uncharacterized protein n=1 Tax=virus sp. ctmTa7 TaxID=2828255 RepID=A0A8S5RCN0_9VIRU|nr:MAG TPA: hypothetical protein [virus sp. ctmTa7]
MMCKDCKYRQTYVDLKGIEFNVCSITNIGHTVSCRLENDKLIKDMDICFNCKYWIGGGDWGLSCQKNYYNCSTNGFDKTCEEFCRKDKLWI